jgi:hypothetical protein
MFVSLEGGFPIINAGSRNQISVRMGATEHNLIGASSTAPIFIRIVMI